MLYGKAIVSLKLPIWVGVGVVKLPIVEGLDWGVLAVERLFPVSGFFSAMIFIRGKEGVMGTSGLFPEGLSLWLRRWDAISMDCDTR